MTKRQANNYLRRIYRLLNSERIPIILQKFPDHWGETDFETISLHPEHPIIPTFIHECLHNLHPYAKERTIERLEAEIVSQLSITQMKHILLRLAVAANKPRPLT